MRKLFTLIILSSLCFRLNAQLKTFHDFTATTIDGKTLNLSDFAGKKVLVVNLASYCGYTCQYPEFVQLDSLYGGPNFAIIGFPCNDFGGQEPYNDSTIWAFAKNMGVKFQMMHKIAIKGTSAIPLYKWLQQKTLNGIANAPVSWNFNKFCIDEAGHWVKHFPEKITPLDPLIVNWIKSPSVITGINDLKNVAEITLANPASQKIDLKITSNTASTYTINIFDIQGRQVDQLFSGQITGEQTISYTSDKLNTGIYFVRVQSEAVNKTIKVSYVE